MLWCKELALGKTARHRREAALPNDAVGRSPVAERRGVFPDEDAVRDKAGNEQRAVGIDGKPARVMEDLLRGREGRRCEVRLPQEDVGGCAVRLRVGIQMNEDSGVVSISDVEVPRGVEIEGGGSVQLIRVGARGRRRHVRLTEDASGRRSRRDRRGVVEAEHAMVACVGHPEISIRIDRHIERLAHRLLSGARIARQKGALPQHDLGGGSVQERLGRPVTKDAVIEVVGDKNLSGHRIHANPLRISDINGRSTRSG